MESELVTDADAATYLSVPRRTLEGWRRSGEGPPFVRVGPRQVRYRKGDLDAWLEHRTVRPGGGAA